MNFLNTLYLIGAIGSIVSTNHLNNARNVTDPGTLYFSNVVMSIFWPVTLKVVAYNELINTETKDVKND